MNAGAETAEIDGAHYAAVAIFDGDAGGGRRGAHSSTPNGVLVPLPVLLLELRTVGSRLSLIPTARLIMRLRY
ncbi:hypothetical protein E05_37020 [Plautia stali symbiont]|nr:hypothetical protein E05_37020 [Plautia stali symbiont]